jgi:hypothetical protein
MIPMTPQQYIMLRFYEALIIATYRLPNGKLSIQGWILFCIGWGEFVHAYYGKEIES